MITRPGWGLGNQGPPLRRLVSESARTARVDSRTEAKPCDGAVGVAQELAHHVFPGWVQHADAIEANELRSRRRRRGWCGGIFRRVSAFWMHFHDELVVVGLHLYILERGCLAPCVFREQPRKHLQRCRNRAFKVEQIGVYPSLDFAN